MCDANLQLSVDKVLGDWIAAGKAFTAYDVTVEIRKQVGSSVNIRHNDVRDGVASSAVLADVINNGEWRYGPHYVGKDSSNDDLFARLFYPDGFDLDTYVPQSRQPAALVVDPTDPAQAVIPTTPVAAVVPQSVVDDGFFHVDDRNRLLVPTKYLTAIGAAAQSQVNVVFADKLYIVNTAVPVGVKSQQQLIERNGDLRVSVGTLLAAGLGLDKFQIENCQYNNGPAVVINNP